MKIIVKRNKHLGKYRSECKRCGSLIEAEEAELIFEHDRDGDLARMLCPACEEAIFFYRNQPYLPPLVQQNEER